LGVVAKDGKRVLGQCGGEYEEGEGAKLKDSESGVYEKHEKEGWRSTYPSIEVP